MEIRQGEVPKNKITSVNVKSRGNNRVETEIISMMDLNSL